MLNLVTKTGARTFLSAARSVRRGGPGKSTRGRRLEPAADRNVRAPVLAALPRRVVSPDCVRPGAGKLRRWRYGSKDADPGSAIRQIQIRQIQNLRPGLLLVAALIVAVSAPAATNRPPSRTIGIEGQASVVLPKPDYRPRPLDDRTELILRLEGVTPLTNGQHRYDFYYMGLEPGPYNLADYLMRPDGGRPDELSDIRIVVHAMLPDDHDGQLIRYEARPFPFVGGYRALLGALAAMWVAGFVVYGLAVRRTRAVATIAANPPAPSLAEQLRPLVEEAANGRLTSDGKALLERLLISYWREKLDLPNLRMVEAVMRLKAHAEAGELLRALERWLHRPGGASASEVASVLEPYRNIAAPASAMEGGKA
jgi:hypothetical protein